MVISVIDCMLVVIAANAHAICQAIQISAVRRSFCSKLSNREAIAGLLRLCDQSDLTEHGVLMTSHVQPACNEVIVQKTQS